MADHFERTVVLLIDDQAIVGAAIGALLSSETDMDFHHCRRAAEAIAAAESVHPSIILLDLMIEDVDGLALLQQLRVHRATAATPIVVLSGHTDAEKRRQALAAGAVDYLVKMPGRADLLACIRRHAMGAGARDDVGRGTAEPAAASADTALDRRLLTSLREADGGDAFARMLIDQFLGEAATQVAGLKDAAARLDLSAVAAIAHGLKGSANTMGATSLGVLCGQMEQHAKRRGNRVVISLLMADIEQTLTTVQHALVAEREALDPR